MKTKTIAIILIAAVLLGTGAFFVMAGGATRSPTGNSIAKVIAESASAEDIYSMFLCPCCGQALDKENICCGMAEEMIAYIDEQLAAGLPKDEVVLKAAEKYGVTAVTETRRDIVREALAQQNPDAFPADRITFAKAVGKKAPDFSLESIKGETVKLSEFAGEKNVVLFFNEGSMCYPSCWDQMAALGSDARFDTDETVTFSIVTDQKSEWEDIVRQVPELAEATILFDSTRAVSSAYDVLSLKSSMHPGRYPGHTYFIIDTTGTIRYTLDDPAMAIRNDALASQLEKLG